MRTYQVHCLCEVEHSCAFNHIYIYHVMLNFNYISPSNQFTILIDSHNGDYLLYTTNHDSGFYRDNIIYYTS